MTTQTRLVLSVQSVTKRFGGLVAVNAVSFDAHAGIIQGIIGQNGAGKTTLFNMIAGSMTMDGGSIHVGDTGVSAMPAWRRSRAGIARTFQIPQPIWSLTVCENVQLGLIAHGRSKAESAREAAEHLDDLGLAAFNDRLPTDLSPGQLRLLEFARASCLKPRVLLLDEVFAGLSHAEQESTAEVVRRLKERGIAIVWIEHNVRMMMNLADRILVMDRGEKIASGTPAEIAVNEQVIDVYLGSRRKRKSDM